jgi:subtilase family serine protease
MPSLHIHSLLVLADRAIGCPMAAARVYFHFGGFVLMVPFFTRSLRTGLLFGASLCALGAVAAHAAPPVATPMITQVDDATVTALPGDRPAALSVVTDNGALPAAMQLPEIRLALKRQPAQQAALDLLVKEQQDKSSPEYHHWLTPAELRAYGPAQSDIDKVTAWLGRQGLTVNSVSRSGMEINFGGSAEAVEKAFHTEIHNVTLHGEAHVTNMAAPSVPSALLPVVVGVTLNNFFPKPLVERPTPAYTAVTSSGTFYAVTPSDFDTIYNETPLLNGSAFGTPITGAGVTVALIEQTQIQPADITSFRTSFGLNGYGGTLTQINPGGCKAPGFIADEVEAALDAEWAGATAPGATLLEAECKTVAPLNFGVETALQNLVEDGTTATAFSISYGGNEVDEGLSFEDSWANLTEEAAAEGIAVFVSTGDSGVSTTEDGYASSGLFINGLSDTPNNTAVGGTDFLDTAMGEDSKYWSSSNSASGGSALSYVPETPWNNSCASTVIATVAKTTPTKLCMTDSSTGQPGVGGSGGQSVYFSKPSWQLTSIPGMPNDNLRDQPDISLFAANGEFAHFYLFCMSDKKEGGSPCDYSNSTDLLGNAAGGTSFASPDFAGIAALIQQAAMVSGSTPQTGNLAPLLYTLAAKQYASKSGITSCNASLGNKIGKTCTFYNVTQGNNAEPCNKGSTDCVGGTTGKGILYNKSVTTAEAYTAQQGYSLAVGLGTVNVTNLVEASAP